MPSAYAHYRFGSAMEAQLPPDARKAVQRFRRLYDVGLHGPDIFFFYNPFVKTGSGSLGSKCHAKTGREFFSQALKSANTEAARAYLYGVLCHYCLDSVCHPYVNEIAAGGEIGHLELETEFDRFLLESDGKTPPCAQDTSSHIRLTAGECETAARFYPPAKGKTIRACTKNMVFFTRLLAAPEGFKRSVLEKGIFIVGKSLRGLLMTVKPNEKCSHLDSIMLSLYHQAAERFPVLLAQLQAAQANGTPLGEEFDLIFG